MYQFLIQTLEYTHKNQRSIRCLKIFKISIKSQIKVIGKITSKFKKTYIKI